MACTLTIEEVEEVVTSRGVSLQDFWPKATGGDRGPVDEDEVDAACRALGWLRPECTCAQRDYGFCLNCQ